MQVYTCIFVYTSIVSINIFAFPKQRRASDEDKEGKNSPTRFATFSLCIVFFFFVGQYVFVKVYMYVVCLCDSHVGATVRMPHK